MADDTPPPADLPPATARESTHATHGESTETPEDDVGVEQTVIVISDFSYTVPEAVAAGSEIVVRNEDGVGHTVTSDDDGVFDVVVPPGEEVSFAVPDDPGEYPFHCIPHPAMTSTLVVE